MLWHALNELGHKIGAKQQYSAVGCMSEATTTLTRAGVETVRYANFFRAQTVVVLPYARHLKEWR